MECDGDAATLSPLAVELPPGDVGVFIEGGVGVPIDGGVGVPTELVGVCGPSPAGETVGDMPARLRKARANAADRGFLLLS
jgi:hypothetical protein